MSEHRRQIQSAGDDSALPAELSALLPDPAAPPSVNGAGEVAVKALPAFHDPPTGTRPTSSEFNSLQQDETDPEEMELAPLKAAAVRYVLEGALFEAKTSDWPFVPRLRCCGASALCRGETAEAVTSH